MGTFEAYVTAAVVFVVWMVAGVIADATLGGMLVWVEHLGGGMFAGPVSWLRAVLQHWALIGMVGILAFVLASALRSRGRAV